MADTQPQQNRRLKQIQINKKKKFVADGVFNAELNSFLQKALVSAGYAGIEVRVTPVKTEIRIKATKVQEVIGPEGRKIRELTYLVQKRFNYQEGSVELLVERVMKKGLCASAQVESIKYKLLNNIPVRLAANSIIKSVMLDGAKGCEVIISGKLKQQRAKTMKFKQGYMIATGQPKLDYVDTAVRHVFFKQGIMGVKIKVMLPYDPHGKVGCKIPIPDNVVVVEPKVEDVQDTVGPFADGTSCNCTTTDAELDDVFAQLKDPDNQYDEDDQMEQQEGKGTASDCAAESVTKILERLICLYEAQLQ